MSIKCLHSVSMVYDDCIPVTADPAGINNGSAVSGMNRSSIIDAYINTGVIDCRSKYRMDTVAIWRSDWTVAWPAENTAALRIGWRFTTGLRGSLSGSFLLAESFLNQVMNPLRFSNQILFHLSSCSLIVFRIIKNFLLFSFLSCNLTLCFLSFLSECI